ncbi:MAG: response regulator [Pseudomonadales bacterium]|nr:response regulator [Pseudomonadales bacterium]
MSDLKILVIDDATFIRDMIKKCMRETFPHLQLSDASDGKKGLAQLKKLDFDLILCDWEMPEMNGDELLKWARDSEKHKKTPFIMVTSRGEKENLIAAIQAGASDYLVKPFNTDILRQKVLKALKKGGKLKAAHFSSKQAPAATGGFAAESVGVLTGGIPQATATVFNDAPTIQPTKKSISAKDNKSLGQAQIRFSHSAHNCVIKRIAEDELMGIIRRPDSTVPGILEQAVVDIALPDNEDSVARINGYVHQLICAEETIDSRFINITIRFVDDDPKKIAFLNEFMSQH